MGGGAKHGKKQQQRTVTKFLRNPCTQVATPDCPAPNAWIPRNRPLLAYSSQFCFPARDPLLDGLQPLSSRPGPAPGPAPAPPPGPASRPGSSLLVPPLALISQCPLPASLSSGSEAGPGPQGRRETPAAARGPQPVSPQQHGSPPSPRPHHAGRELGGEQRRGSEAVLGYGRPRPGGCRAGRREGREEAAAAGKPRGRGLAAVARGGRFSDALGRRARRGRPWGKRLGFLRFAHFSPLSLPTSVVAK